MKAVLALAAASVALTAAPAEARHHYSDKVACAKYRHGTCVKWKRLTRAQARHARWNVGYRFGPSYGYTAYNTIPRRYVSQYSLSPDYRYVYNGDYIYVVDPKTYAITRVLEALTR